MKVIIKESKPIIFVINYMLYAFIVACTFFYIYINEYGGKMPPTGSLWNYAKDIWQYFLTLGIAPILLKILTKYLETQKNKKLSEQANRRITDNNK